MDLATAAAGATKDFVIANPKLIAGGASVAAATVSFACPMLVAVPVLGALGFGAAGPVAGSAAVAAQSTFGVGAVFSALQSAAMGGYGVPIVAGVVKGGAVVAGAAVGVAAKYGGKA